MGPKPAGQRSTLTGRRTAHEDHLYSDKRRSHCENILPGCIGDHHERRREQNGGNDDYYQAKFDGGRVIQRNNRQGNHQAADDRGDAIRYAHSSRGTGEYLEVASLRVSTQPVWGTSGKGPLLVNG